MTYEQFVKDYSVEILSFNKQSKNDPSVRNIFKVRVTHKKEQIFDDYFFDNYCNDAEPCEGYLGRNNPYLGKHIIKKSIELRQSHLK